MTSLRHRAGKQTDLALVFMKLAFQLGREPETLLRKARYKEYNDKL